MRSCQGAEPEDPARSGDRPHVSPAKQCRAQWSSPGRAALPSTTGQSQPARRLRHLRVKKGSRAAATPGLTQLPPLLASGPTPCASPTRPPHIPQAATNACSNHETHRGQDPEVTSDHPRSLPKRCRADQRSGALPCVSRVLSYPAATATPATPRRRRRRRHLLARKITDQGRAAQYRAVLTFTSSRAARYRSSGAYS